jgi:hypothetical protein
MTQQQPAPHEEAAIVRVGVGTRFVYYGDIVTIIEMSTAGRDNAMVVEDRGGKHRYRVALGELLASGRAGITGLGTR